MTIHTLTLRKELQARVDKLKLYLEKVDAYANRMPFLADIILEEGYTGEEVDYVITFGNSFFDTRIGHSLGRECIEYNTYLSGELGGYTGYIYIHPLDLMDIFDYSEENINVDNLVNSVDKLFYDKPTRIFYLEESQVEAYIIALVAWIKSVKRIKS